MTDFTLGPGPLTPEFEQVKSDIGIVENGNTATHAIPKGYYVIWKGDLYVAKSDISSGTALSAESNGNLTAKTQGIGAEVSSLNRKMPTSEAFSEILIPSGSDLNNYRTAGTFIVPNDATATQITNIPRAASGRLIVMYRTSSSYIRQEYIPTASSVMIYMRNYNNGTWTDWIELAPKFKKTKQTCYLKDFSWNSSGQKYWGTLTVPSHFFAILQDFSNLPNGYSFEFFDTNETTIEVFGTTNSFDNNARIHVNLFSY